MLQADLVYTRAKADVKVNQTILAEKMDPEMINSNIDDIVTYHWNKKKRELQHQKVVDMLSPVDSADRDEIQYQIDRRKKVLQEGEAFYNAIDGNIQPYGGFVGNNTSRTEEVSRILNNMSMDCSIYKSSPLREHKVQQVKEIVKATAPVQHREDEFEVHHVREEREAPMATPERPAPQSKIPKKLEQSNYDSDIQILKKELKLGKDLLDSAIRHISENVLEKLSKLMGSEINLNIMSCFLNLLSIIVNGRERQNLTSQAVTSTLEIERGQILHDLRRFKLQIESGKIEDERVRNLKDLFLTTCPMEEDADSNISVIRHFLCEAFCLADIRMEIDSLQNQTSFISADDQSQPRQSLDPGAFGSPGNFISPISQKKDETIDMSQNMMSPSPMVQRREYCSIIPLQS